ncbi:hypothetical protein [Haladaptatus sp. DYSN1]|uniref:hypothetical protein n=1 Tax=unclassified Haladaptatus TaxID=2622732 RepID=UPI0024070CEB|nr:hypothetical protein [Haladaptatus sp. DYSN1]
MSERTSPEVAADEDREYEDLLAQVELLEHDNRRLRAEYVRARQASHRREALWLLLIGAVAAATGVLYPESQQVLFALAGIGLFAAVLTYFLTPEQFIPASVGERVYAAFGVSGATLVADLGLQDTTVYVPVPDATAPFAGVRLFVPLHPDYEVPPPQALESAIVATATEAERGLALYPTGAALFREYEATVRRGATDTPAGLAEQFCETLENDFELVSRATPDQDVEAGRITIGVKGSVYGPVDRFDHPVASFIGTGFAVKLNRPVVVETTPAGGRRVDYLVTCRWEPGEDAET